MKLRPAPRGPEMVNALSDQNVRDIVTMLLQILNQESFRNFANFLVKLLHEPRSILQRHWKTCA